jgi:hydrogenase small subunit
MLISRRDFLKWAGGIAAATKMIDLSKFNVLASEAEAAPSIIWLQGASCTGCSVSTLNLMTSVENAENLKDLPVDIGSVVPLDIGEVVIHAVDMEFHPNLSTLSGTSAPSGLDYMKAMYDFADANSGNFILVTEGAIFKGDKEWNCVIGQKEGKDITMKAAVEYLGAKASYVVAAGACASFGGIPGAAPDADVITTRDLLKNIATNPVVNLPSCPVHPAALVQTLVDLLAANTMPVLDKENRPIKFYDKQIHANCERRGMGVAKKLGEVGCYKQLGCKGPKTEAHCPSLFWNRYEDANGNVVGGNYCMKSNHPCIGCADPSFPTNPLNI